MGPLLFFLYVLDLPDGVLGVAYMFADDTKLLSIRSINDLNRLGNWAISNQMEFNYDKSHLISFLAGKNITTPFYLNRSRLKETTCEKDLGVHISSSLKWNDHIKLSVQNAFTVLFLIKRNCSYHLASENKLNLYKFMVVPVLTYGSVAWFASKSNKKLIEGVQRDATDGLLAIIVVYHIPKDSLS